MPVVETILWNDVDEHVKRQSAELWMTVWPNGRDIDVEARLQRMNTSYPSLADHKLHIVIVDRQLRAVARTFRQTVGLIRAGNVVDDLEVLALASVCSHPEERGQGLGEAVVTSAFACLADDEVALFQTGVPKFYERFDSRTISNDVFTSAPGVDGFTDSVVMIHPGAASWDHTARIDLRIGGW